MKKRKTATIVSQRVRSCEMCSDGFSDYVEFVSFENRKMEKTSFGDGELESCSVHSFFIGGRLMRCMSVGDALSILVCLWWSVPRRDKTRFVVRGEITEYIER